MNHVGCPRCGSQRITQKKVTTETGWGLFIMGGLLCFVGLFVCFLLPVGLIMGLIGACLTERRARCKDCKWTWSV